MKRDFSDASKQKMLSLVAQVESEKWGNFTDWVGDRWYDFESWIGVLGIKNYINNVNAYHKKVIDKNNATEQTINKIFTAVRGVDSTYGVTFGNIHTNLSHWLRYIDQLAEIVEPGKGRFNGQYIKSALDGVLKDISDSNVQRVKDRLVQDINGQLIFDEDLLLEYIKKNPAEMTDDEQAAVLAVIAQLEETVAFYESAATWGGDELGADFWNRASWISDTEEFDSFSAISAHYNELYVSILDGIIEQGEDSNTFGGAIFKFSNGDTDFTILGLDASTTVGKIFGSASATAYAAKWKSEHTEQYFAKLEVSGKGEAALLNKIKPVSDKEDSLNDKLEAAGKRIDESVTKYYDEDGNEISAKEAGFYKRDYTLAEIDASANVSASLYDGTYDVGENGKVNVVVGNAEAHASFSAGLYGINANGDKQLMPGFNGEIGASATALNVDWDQQLIGDENLGVNLEAGVTAGKVGAKASGKAQLFDNDGSIDIQASIKGEAEAIAAEAEGSLGVNVLGGEVEATAGINVGIGAHAEVGYQDGKFKFDVGASLGVGVSLDVEIDVGGMVDTVVDTAQVAWDGIQEGWSDFKDGWNDFWDW